MAIGEPMREPKPKINCDTCRRDKNWRTFARRKDGSRSSTCASCNKAAHIESLKTTIARQQAEIVGLKADLAISTTTREEPDEEGS